VILRLSFFTLIMAFAGCRARTDSSRVKDITPSLISDSGGLEIELDPKAFQAATFRLTQSSGKLELWSMLSDTLIDKKMQARLGGFKINLYNMISGTDHGSGPPQIKQSISKTFLSFTGIPGKDPSKNIPLNEKAGALLVTSKNLSAEFFSDCPTGYLGANGKLQTSLRKDPNVPPFTIEGDMTPTITKVVYRPDGITWKVNCERIVSWPDIVESKLMIKVTFEVQLNADRKIFPGATSDSKYPSLKMTSLITEREGFGTRYFRDYASFNTESIVLQRWNPLRARIVIDDVKNIDGKALGNSEYGNWIQEALKIATADLRMKLPSLGKKIILTSEQPRLQPDIAFSLGDAMGAAGMAMMLLDDKNGEIRQARIGIGGESNLNGRIQMIDGFHKLGLIDDPKKSFRDSFLIMVTHELGHTLGLRHNFAGYGLNKNWGNDLQSVMSYAMIGFPMEFISEKVEWKPHDILSLKILYSELGGEDQRSRQDLIAEVLKYPLSQDEMLSENLFGDFAGHFVTALKYLEVTNHPKMAQFRETNPDWKSKIKAIYKDAYDVELQ